MPDSTVDNLTTSGALTGTEKFYADNGVNDVEVTANQIKTFATASIPTFPLSVANGGTAQTTSAEMIGENIQACSDDSTPDRIADRLGSYDSSADTGKGVPPWAVAGSAVLASGSVSSTAALDLALDTTGFSNFKIFKLHIITAVPASDGASAFLRFSDDGGSTFEADAADYSWVHIDTPENTGAATTVVGSNSDTKIELCLAVGSASGENCNFEITIHDPAASAKTRVHWLGTRINASTQPVQSPGSGGALAATASTDVRFLFSTGNITSAKYTLIGYI